MRQYTRADAHLRAESRTAADRGFCGSVHRAARVSASHPAARASIANADANVALRIANMPRHAKSRIFDRRARLNSSSRPTDGCEAADPTVRTYVRRGSLLALVVVVVVADRERFDLIVEQ